MTDFDNFLPQKNRNEYSTKRVQTASLIFDLTMSALYVIKPKMTRKQPTAYAVHSVELIVPDLWRKSFNVRFFSHLLEHFFSSLPTNIFYVLVGFIKNLSSNSIWLILTCKLKLNGRELVTCDILQL